MGSASEERYHIVMSSAIGWAHAQNDSYEYVFFNMYF